MKRIIPIIALIIFAMGFPATSAGQAKCELSANATVRRDGRGIPYIEAANDRDLYYLQGRETAKDRLWQMELLRRVARGQVSELFGKLTLEEDKRWRRFGFSQIAEQALPLLDSRLRLALEAYACGVNDVIDSMADEELPSEFKVLKIRPRHWMPTDTIVVGKILSDALSTTWQFDVAREGIAKLPESKQKDLLNKVTDWDVILFGSDRKDETKPGVRTLSQIELDSLTTVAANDAAVRKTSLERVGLYAEDLAASNNWVISGKLTADGLPMLANDPHLAPQAPGIWHLVHLVSPGMRVAGVTFPGVPGVVLGHNSQIAWGATNVGPDVQDLYREEFNDKGEYRSGDTWRPVIKRLEAIKVRPNPLSPDTEIVEYEVEETANGVLIPAADGNKYALRWTARDPRNQEFEAFFAVNRASDWTGFREALKSYGGAMQNFIYADVKGNIGWQPAGRVPIRKTGDGARIYSGANGEGDWVGTIPFDELPRLYNPKNGIIMTANQRIIGTDYKYQQLARDAAMPWRARRILERLTEKKSFTMDDFTSIQTDSFNIPVSMLAKEIVRRGTASPETLKVLTGWDGFMKKESQAALLANEIRNVIAAKIAADNKGVLPQILREKLLYWVVEKDAKEWLPAGYSSYDSLIAAADEEARAALTKRYGADSSKWVWGAAWVSRFTHPLAMNPLIGANWASPSVPIDGSGQSPNVGSNVSMRLIASPGNWDATRHVIPLGESGDPKSPHWKDQFEMWRTGAPAVFPFSKEAVQKAAVETTEYGPGPIRSQKKN